MTQISEDCFFNIEQILSKMNAQKLSLFDATLLIKSGQNFISLNEVAVMMTSLAHHLKDATAIWNSTFLRHNP